MLIAVVGPHLPGLRALTVQSAGRAFHSDRTGSEKIVGGGEKEGRTAESEGLGGGENGD